MRSEERHAKRVSRSSGPAKATNAASQSERPSNNPWLDMMLLAAESQTVIALRMMKLAAGGVSATDEIRRMTTEKVTAAAEAGVKLMTGGSPDSVVKDYRRKVRSNIRRLSK